MSRQRPIPGHMKHPLLTSDIAESLLETEERSDANSAEKQHSWSTRWDPALRDLPTGSVLDQLWDGPLMRTYDIMSGSQPLEGDCRMFARAPRMRLDEDKIRKRTLEMHASHKNREATPYISFTNCSRSLEKLANERRVRERRSEQGIVVIDPRVRFELGLPVLHYEAEMTHYEVKNPYETNYWRNHYLCLWEVTPAEVVGIWRWDDLRQWSSWYENIILPAVAQHRQHMEPTEAVQHYGHRIDAGLSESVDESEDDIDQSDVDDSHDSEGPYDLESPYDSDDSYERVCEENFSGELMNMLEDLSIG